LDQGGSDAQRTHHERQQQRSKAVDKRVRRVGFPLLLLPGVRAQVEAEDQHDGVEEEDDAAIELHRVGIDLEEPG
jgi:hypothetical protein